MDKSRSVRFPAFILSAIPGLAAICLITYVCFEFHLNLTITGFLYLIIVVLQSLRGNFVSSALVALLTVGCLDFFFTPRLFSFEVSSPLDILALNAYLITGLVITRLTTKAHRETAISNNQRRQVDLLYELASRLLALDPDCNLLEESAVQFRDVFGLETVCLFDALNGEFYYAGNTESSLSEATKLTSEQGLDTDEGTNGTALRCLRATGKVIGAVGFKGLRGSELTIGPLAALAAAMLERTRAFQKASHSAAAAQTELFRGAVLDALAHEFKTPLATILTAAGGLRETHPLLQQQSELAELIEAEASRLSGLTSQVLRTGRLNHSDIKPRLERTDISGLVTNMVDQYSRKCCDRRFHLTKEAAPAEVMADGDLLELAVKQLLDNACKYSPVGSEVRVRIELSPEQATVRVGNTGKAIRGIERTRIFERFYRGTEARNQTPGSGLGLYFAHQILCAHGGSMELEDDSITSETGASFRLVLPLAGSESRLPNSNV